MDVVINYKAHPTIKLFHQDESLVKGLMGPVGSGKTTGCCFELMRRILSHPKEDKTKPSSSVALVVRKTYKELKDTTLRSWLNLFPPQHFGQFYYSDMIHKIRLKDLSCDVLFRSLDRPSDESKLLSLEVTFIYVNEAKDINFSLIQMLIKRLRYPNSHYPKHFKGMIMDTNPPDVSHWWYKTFEEKKPKGWRLFSQPSGISKQAENIKNLPKGYYTDQMSAAGKNWLKVYRDGQYGFISRFKPVYPEYKDHTHCKKLSKPNKNLPLTVGMDFGLSPAAVFVQKDAFGCWQVYAELTTFDKGAFEFAGILKQKVKSEFKDFEINYIGDPAGNQKSQTDAKTVFDVLAAAQIKAVAASTNNSLMRKEVLKKALLKTQKKASLPGILIDPACKMLRKAMLGGYCYKPKSYAQNGSGYLDKPNKNKYSHVAEALEYALIGSGALQDIMSLGSQFLSKNNLLPKKFGHFEV